MGASLRRGVAAGYGRGSRREGYRLPSAPTCTFPFRSSLLGAEAGGPLKRLFLLAFIWGWSFLFIKVAVGGMTPPTLAAIRLALGAAVVLTVLRARGWEIPRGWRWWRHFLVVGLFGSALPFTMLAWGEQHVSSALTAVLNASTPLFAAIMAGILVGDRLRPAQTGGLLLGFLGVAVAAGIGGTDFSQSSRLGEAASVAAGACYGLSFAYARRHLMGLVPLQAAAGQLMAGTLLLLPAAVATTLRGGFAVNARQALAVVLLGVLGTGVAYVISYRLIADVGPTRAAAVTYLIPIVAVTVGVVFLDEPFSIRIVAGGLLTVAGIAILGTGRRPAPTDPLSAPHA